VSEQRALESACLAPELLARYLDDRLSGDERESVEAHLASCDDCREVLVVSFRAGEALDLDASVTPAAPATTPPATTASAPTAPAPAAVIPIREDRRRILWAGAGLLAAAAVLLLIVQLDPAWWRSLTGRPGVTKELEALVAAAGTQNRFIEPRLTGGFKYGTLRSVTRSANPTRRLHTDVSLAILTIEKAAEGGGIEQVHAQGIAKIVEGDLDGAVQTLDRVAAQGGRSRARILTDLSAAYFARWRERGDDNDARNALEAAQHAVDADASIPEAWFNLALAREAIGDARRAREAWNQYLSVEDPKSPWRAEAQQHLAPIPP
jgi:tetratricopeptide (TPR) repeat protein